MKTLSIILLISLMNAVVFANPGENSDYIVTKDGKCIVADVQIGLFRFLAKQTSGTILRFKYSEIASYRKDGEIFIKKPLYRGNEKTSIEVFMRLIAWRNGLGLYAYQDLEHETGKNERYLIYRDDHIFWLEVDPKNVETVSIFFGLSKIEI